MQLQVSLSDWAPHSTLGYVLYGSLALWLVIVGLVAWQLLHYRTLLKEVPGPPR